MKIVKAGYEILTPLDGAEILKHIERIGRVCYKSEDKITDESAPDFVKKLIKNGHEAMIEHFSISVKFICDRGVSHEIVRHRIASFAQESTRYCNYSNKDGGCTFIQPCFIKDDEVEKSEWFKSMGEAERAYLKMLEIGYTPQKSRSVLPNSLKTEVVMTANLREWRNVLRLRTRNDCHPQMLEIMRPLLRKLQSLIPVAFEDINV